MHWRSRKVWLEEDVGTADNDDMPAKDMVSLVLQSLIHFHLLLVAQQ